jgi:hypothetical protein
MQNCISYYLEILLGMIHFRTLLHTCTKSLHNLVTHTWYLVCEYTGIRVDRLDNDYARTYLKYLEVLL